MELKLSKVLLIIVLLALVYSGYLNVPQKETALKELTKRSQIDAGTTTVAPQIKGYSLSVDWVKRHIVKPNGKPRRLQNENVVDYSQFRNVPVIINKYLNNRKNGKFLEVGAFDGEKFSTSLQLEKDYNWTGLLIEASQTNYKTLLEKNRDAYALSACLSDVKEPETMWMGEGKGTGATMMQTKNSSRFEVTCVPLQAVFDAIGWLHFDMITLDVEGHELKVLKSVDFSRTKVDIWQIEANKVDTDALHKFMTSVGYEKLTVLDIDWIYGRLGRQD